MFNISVQETNIATGKFSLSDTNVEAENYRDPD